jgi:Secretion system C-terminal sorting domain
MKIIYTLVFILISWHSAAQNWEWAVSTGTINSDSPTDHYTDRQGYTYISLLQNGNIAVKKIDPSGAPVWTASAGMGWARGIAADESGNVFVTGTYDGSTNIGGTILTDPNGNQDGFLAKLDEDGNWVWAVRCGGPGDDLCSAVDVDNNTGDVVITGYFEDSAYFDSIGVFAFWAEDMFVARYNTNGSSLWVNTAGDFGKQQGIDLKVDQLGYTYVTGEYIDDIQFGPDLLTFSGPGGKDVFIAKVSSAGNFLWGNHVHGTNNNIWVAALAIDSVFGGCYIHGRYSGSTTFPNGVNYGNPNGVFPYIAKIDSSGNGIWNFRYGFGSSSGAVPVSSDIVVTQDSVYYSGVFFNMGTANIDGYVLSSNGWYDIYVGVMDHSQNTALVIQLTDQSPSSESGGYLSLDPVGALIITGSFNANTSIGGITLNNVGSGDLFVAKEGCSYSAGITSSSVSFCTGDSVLFTALPSGATNYSWYFNGAPLAVNSDSIYAYQQGNYQVVIDSSNCASISPAIDISLFSADTIVTNITACNGDVVLFEGNMYNATGTYHVSYVNLAGCDSTMTLNLTIHVIDTAVTQTGNTLLANNNGATYQWLDCNNGFLPVLGASDSSYTPTVSGSYAVLISENGCVDTSACYNVTVVGVIENDFDGNLIAYPNPTTGNLSITLPQVFKEINVKITTTAGQFLSAYSITNTQQLILDINEPNGIYLIEIFTNSGSSAVIRVLIEN